jgi:hypothetical protein
MKTATHPVLLAIGLCFFAASAHATLQTINNDAWWKDQHGNPLYAQGGGINYFNGTYYMYGVEYNGAHTYYNGGGSNSDTTFLNIPCYTSTDLVHWTYSDEAVTAATLPGATWVGRLGSVCFNASTSKYVMWVEYDGTDGTGMACLTSSSPTGAFTLHNTQATVTNVFDGVPGDSTVFCDRNHNNTPYFICSDGHGREHAYVCTFNSSQTAINSAVLISEWPQGQEADCMFEFSGTYHLCMSQLAGWSFSHAYEVRSTKIQTPSSYSADADFSGTDATNTYWSQISYFVDVHGSSQETIVLVGDRWADFDSTYSKAGHGSNYLIMGPVSVGTGAPTFNAYASWELDATSGLWQQ